MKSFKQLHVYSGRNFQPEKIMRKMIYHLR